MRKVFGYDELVRADELSEKSAVPLYTDNINKSLGSRKLMTPLIQ